MSAEPYVNRYNRTRFVRNRFEIDRTQIAAKPRRRGDGYVPGSRPGTGHLVREPPVLRHDI
jgi:hypothetical protein